MGREAAFSRGLFQGEEVLTSPAVYILLLMTFCYSVNTDNTYIFGQDEADADEKFQECAKELEDVLRKRKSPTLQEFLVVLALSAFPPSGCHT